MDSERRNTLRLRAKTVDLKSLKDLGNEMKIIQRGAFIRKYGNILNLLEVKVQIGAITALAQFYDPPLRCFTFRDFQLAPTLEEFGRILGYPLTNGNPYRGVGRSLTLKKIAKALKIDVRELSRKEEKKGNVRGFSREYLEQKARDLANKKEWDTFRDVLALIIYGIVLFPNFDNFVDFTAIDVFLAVKQDGENPVPAILSDVYYSLHLRHENKGGMILCCLHVLYIWFRDHMFNKDCIVEDKTDQRWAQSIADLKESSILWYSREQGVEDVIYRCGDFPNVPLIGTKGCINYNPALALRQLGYPMEEKPADELLKAFVLHYMPNGDPSVLRRMSRAWDRIIRKSGRELGGRNCIAKEPYREWVKKRVSEIKLPFFCTPSSEPEILEPPPITNEEVDELKAKIFKYEEEKKELQEKLEKTSKENKNLRFQITCKEGIIERNNKRMKIEEDKRRMIGDALRGANEELTVRNQQRDAIIDKAYKWNGYWEDAVAAKKVVQKELQDLKRKLKEVKAECENRVNNERQEKEKVEEMFVRQQDELGKGRADLSELKNCIEYQEKLYEDLKKAMIDISKLLKEDDTTTHPLNTPAKVYEFVEYCKILIVELREKAVCSTK